MAKKDKIRKDKSNKNNKNGLSKKRLLSSEYEQYKRIGEIDHSQNWLELFTPTVVQDLFTIMNSCSDNQLKSDYIRKEMSYYGFEPVGLGTNIYTMQNPAYPGVIFKFALDDNGLADNFNDTLLQDLVDDFLVEECGDKPRYTRVLARHPSAIVSVQERKVVVADQDRMDTFRGSILKTLQKLSEKFMIIDLSPTLYHLNYGIDRNGDWCFVDASDLYPLVNIDHKVRCNKAVGWDEKKRKVRRCGGRLRYNEDFSNIICENCGSEFLPLEIRPKDKEEKGKMANSICDGISIEEREEMRRAEIKEILGEHVPETDREKSEEKVEETSRNTPEQSGKYTLPTKQRPATIFVAPTPAKDDDDEEDVVEVPTTHEPSKEVQQETATSFTDYLHGKNLPEQEMEEADDEDEDEEDGNVVLAYGREATTLPETEADDPNESDTSDNPEDSGEDTGDDDGLYVEPRITYTVTNYDPSKDAQSLMMDNDQFPGIVMHIQGDFEEAFEDFGLSLYVQLGDDTTITQAISADTFRKILRETVAEIQEEQRAFKQ